MSYEPIHLTGQKLFYQEDVRFSSRQKGLVPYSGFKGHIEAEGDCREYLPWLRLGQHLHIGKWTSMGFGQYRLQEYH